MILSVCLVFISRFCLSFLGIFEVEIGFDAAQTGGRAGGWMGFDGA
jgi:hypothetical protein